MRVFGSRARGDADEYSDLDVFIETEALNLEIKMMIKDVTWEVGIENCLVISPLIFSRSELTETALKSSSIVQNIMSEGIII